MGRAADSSERNHRPALWRRAGVFITQNFKEVEGEGGKGQHVLTMMEASGEFKLAPAGFVDPWRSSVS